MVEIKLIIIDNQHDNNHLNINSGLDRNRTCISGSGDPRSIHSTTRPLIILQIYFILSISCGLLTY